MSVVDVISRMIQSSKKGVLYEKAVRDAFAVGFDHTR